MQSSYGANSNYADEEEDPFAPNPFRVQQPQQQQPYMQQQPQQQPYLYQQQPQYPPQPTNVQYLSGTMDQNAATQNNQAPASSYLSWGGWLACVRMDTYQVYFDVDTADILGRLKAALLFFHLPDYFRVDTLGDARNVNNPENNDESSNNNNANETPILAKGPDLYGPLWIACTLVFTLAVTSNMLLYFDHWRNFSKQSTPSSGGGSSNSTEYAPSVQTDMQAMEYDLTHLIHALSVVATFSVGLPTFFWLATICMGMNKVPWVMWICCYGYCLVPYIVVTSLLWMPWWSIAQWILLLLATLASGCFVLRNLANPLLQQDPGKAATFVLAFPVTHFIFMCILKFSFYTYSSAKK